MPDYPPPIVRRDSGTGEVTIDDASAGDMHIDPVVGMVLPTDQPGVWVYWAAIDAEGSDPLVALWATDEDSAIDSLVDSVLEHVAALDQERRHGRAVA